MHYEDYVQLNYRNQRVTNIDNIFFLLLLEVRTSVIGQQRLIVVPSSIINVGSL